MPQPFRRVSRDFRSLTRPIPSTRRTQWSPEEEEALRKGVKKYGAGKWRFIQKDPVLGKILNQRSNVDLKVSPRATAETRPFPTADSRPPEVGGVPCHRDTARPPDFSPRRRPNPGQVEKHVSRPQHRCQVRRARGEHCLLYTSDAADE